MAENLPNTRGEGGDPKDRVAFWTQELERAERREKTFRRRARETIERYEAEAEEERTEYDDKILPGSQFNILWANTETLRPSLYAGVPRPVVRRRFKTRANAPELEAGRVASQVLERALSFSVDQYDFDEMAEDCTNDALLPGRMQARVHLQTAVRRIDLQRRELEDGTVAYARGDQILDPDKYTVEGENAFIEEISLQQVFCTHVPWDDFLHSKAKKWRKVWWVAFQDWLNKDEVKARFGTSIANKIDYKHQHIPSAGMNETFPGQTAAVDDADSEPAPVARFQTIWNKRTRKVIVWTDGLSDRFVTEMDDPLRLQGFFPCPAPVNSVPRPSSLIPAPEYTMYQHQAIELDRITARIANLVEAIKAVGGYDSSMGDNLQRIFRQPDLTLVPIDGMSAFLEKGGMNSIAWLQIEQYSKAVDQLVRQRAQVIQIIYEITGISDLLRGSTDPRETASAQNLKAQFGSRRLSRRQARHARFYRDLYRLKAELIAEHFTPDQLQLMTGAQVTPEVMRALRSDVIREFSIDIETSATAAPDEAQEKQDVTELFGAMQSLGITAANMPPAVTGALALYGIRHFRAGRDIEDVIQAAVEQAPQEAPPNPDVIRAQAEVQRAQQKAQLEQQVAASDLQRKEAIATAESRRKDQEARAEIKRKREEHQLDLFLKREESEARIELMREEARQTLKLREMSKLVDLESKTVREQREPAGSQGDEGMNGKSIVVVEQKANDESVQAMVERIGELLSSDGSKDLLQQVLSELQRGNAQREEMQRKAESLLALREREGASLQ